MELSDLYLGLRFNCARSMMWTPWTSYDFDAIKWISAVETADGQLLEPGVRAAMNRLVMDMKAASVWVPLSKMTVRMGARTLAGALIDIKTPSTSWTNNNFVSGDYNRTTGLIGNGTTKYLDPGITNDSLAQNDRSIFEYLQATASSNTKHYAGAGLVSGATGDFSMRYDTSTTLRVRCLGNVTTDPNANAVGLIGMSRSGASTWTSRGGQADQANTQTSAAPNSKSIFFYAVDNSGATNHSDHRGRAGGVGANLSLSDLETCIATYVTSIVALGL